MPCKTDDEVTKTLQAGRDSERSPSFVPAVVTEVSANWLKLFSKTVNRLILAAPV
jgi:hypothetical protein